MIHLETIIRHWTPFHLGCRYPVQFLLFIFWAQIRYFLRVQIWDTENWEHLDSQEKITSGGREASIQLWLQLARGESGLFASGTTEERETNSGEETDLVCCHSDFCALRKYWPETKLWWRDCWHRCLDYIYINWCGRLGIAETETLHSTARGCTDWHPRL